MAGQPIIRIYRQRLEEAGGPKAVLDRMASGERFPDIAASIKVSRAFLSHTMFRTVPGGRAAVWTARYRATEAAARRAYECAIAKGGPLGPALEWIQERGGFPALSSPTPAEPSGWLSSPTPSNDSGIGKAHLEALRILAKESSLGRRRIPEE